MAIMGGALASEGMAEAAPLLKVKNESLGSLFTALNDKLKGSEPKTLQLAVFLYWL